LLRSLLTVTVTALTLQGHGLGHGIGLSQWGAEARARAGETAGRILAFYYPSTTVRRVAPHPIRVLIAERPLRIRRLGAVTRVGGTRYPGVVTVARGGGRVAIVDTVPLEEYVADVVSSECPGYWPAAALEAQAIASRSYALASLRPSKPFDVYADDRSQNFHGLLKHLPRAVAAARATRGLVLTYRGAVVSALFSASNGGVTSVPDGVWGSPATPWFRVARDPYDRAGPDARWGPVHLSLDAIRRAFPDVPADVTAVKATRNAGERVVELRFTGADGTEAAVSGYAFQQRFGLRSTFFTFTAGTAGPTD
jgi:stage II sporulation protein D